MTEIVSSNDPERAALNLCHVDVEPDVLDAIENGRNGLRAVVGNQRDTFISACDLAIYLKWATIPAPAHHAGLSEHPIEPLRTVPAATASPLVVEKHEGSATVRSNWPIDNAVLARPKGNLPQFDLEGRDSGGIVRQDLTTPPRPELLDLSTRPEVPVWGTP